MNHIESYDMHVLHTTLIRNCLRLGQIVKSEICSLFAAADSCVVRTQTITGGRRLQGWEMGQMGLALRASCVFLKGCLWYFYGVPMGFQKDVYGISMICL